ncbi:hypothetical protein FKK85_20215 [Escherichia coli]|nr:hypothetical protein [Escherichia coli]
MGSCAAPSAKGDDKFITTDYLQQCQSPPGKSGTTWLTSFALIRIPSRLIAKKRAKERRSLSANGPITHAGSIDPLSGVSDI